ncbi:MAG: hypothetical protein GY822_26170 [Deltaproteobacteria bacterium]|nr:hypothetical protein [Deltaproteobacteria bacterium]
MIFLQFLRQFGTQESKPWRNFQLVFSLLSLNFILPAFSYTFAPDLAVTQFLDVNEILGGAPFTFPEEQSRVGGISTQQM